MSTPHGSHLYGLAHANSDNDTFEVYDRLTLERYEPKQLLEGKRDVLRLGYDEFVRGVAKGVPQFLEALYSPYKTVNKLDHLRLHPAYWTTVNTYLRTAKSFWRDDPTDPKQYKLRRHSARLAVNLQEFMQKGYFNPVLDDNGREWCEAYATAAHSYWSL